MVKLANIKRNDVIIECDIYPEDSSAPGRVSASLVSGELLDYELPEGYEYCKNHAFHAGRALAKLSMESELPGEKTIMWY